MDIQRPSAPGTPQPSPVQQPTVVSPSGSLSRPATMEYTRPRPEDPAAPSFTPAPQPEPMTEPKQKKSKKGLVIGLFVTLFVGLAAAGAGYYFMVYNKSEPAPVQNETPVATEAEPAKIEATPEGVDAATDEIDKQLNSVDDSQDFTNNDVSDDTLGL